MSFHSGQEDFIKTQNLILAVRRNPCLYDQTDHNYRNEEHKESIWAEISAEIGERRIHKIKSKWDHLYKKYVSLHSGMGMNQVCKVDLSKDFKFYKDMIFLKNSIIQQISEKEHSAVDSADVPPFPQKLSRRERQQQQQQRLGRAEESRSRTDNSDGYHHDRYDDDNYDDTMKKRRPPPSPPRWDDPPRSSSFPPRHSSPGPSSRSRGNSSSRWNSPPPPLGQDRPQQQQQQPPRHPPKAPTFPRTSEIVDVEVDFFFRSVSQQVKRANLSHANFMDLQTFIINALAETLPRYND